MITVYKTVADDESAGNLKFSNSLMLMLSSDDLTIWSTPPPKQALWRGGQDSNLWLSDYWLLDFNKWNWA